MAINLNKTKPETVPAPLQSHLAMFLPLLSKETLIEVALGLNKDLTAAKADVTLRQQEATALDNTVEELRTALGAEIGRGDAHSRNTEWWRKRNSELHNEVSALKNEQRNLRGSLRSLVNEKSAFIHEVAALKRQVEELQANRAAPFNDEWDSWSDAALAGDTKSSTRTEFTVDLTVPTPQEWVDWANKA